MAYPYGFTLEDLYERLTSERIAEITDNDPSKVETAAHDTAAEIELYAGRYYATPLAPFTAGLRTIFLDLWRWRLIFNCKPVWLTTDDAKSDEHAIARQRKRLEVWLEGLASDTRETLLPGIADLSSGTAGKSDGAWSTGATALMTRRTLLRI